MTGFTGRTLGQYEIIEEIGHGGMADVYRAVQPSIGREVAVKVLPAHFLQDRTFLDRFTREVKVIAQLQHPRILPVHDFGEQDGVPYIVMAYMPGGTLADRIRESPDGLPLDAAAHYVAQIAEALDYAHDKGIIHRDFKPSNVLLDERNNTYLADFGIAKVTEATAQLTGSGIVGTPAYMAPEMIERGGVTSLIDVYAVGVTLYQMLTAQLPFEADTPMGTALAHVSKPIPDVRALRPDLSDRVQAVIERGMAKDPMERYPTAGDLAADLSAAVAPAGWPAAREEAAELVREPAAPAAVPTPPDAMTRDVTEAASVEDVYATAEKAAVARPEARRPPASPRRLPAWAWIVGGIVGVALLVGVLVLMGVVGSTPAATEPMNIPEPSRPALTAADCDAAGLPEEACTGVTRNADWEPVIQEFNGVEMALVPVGCFMMGSEDGNSDEMPIHEVCFERPFWIDVDEVTNGQFGSVALGCTDWSSGNTQPRICVSWYEVVDYCEARGARLPTEAEWEYAARGPDGLVYPWGNAFDCRMGNFDDETRYDTYVVEGGVGCDGFAVTAPVGRLPGRASWVGAYGLSGNVWEWVADWYDEGYYGVLPEPAINPQGPDSGGYRVLRGGSWRSSSADDLRSAYRFWLNPDNADDDPGFRCARDY